ncbi:MAG: hypothetical protein LBK65_08280 [Tannerellaceae bacterium]|jgi:hypothetical protein|nr:hypothetical protein [Tannerellaceae bacterium]
MKKILFIFIVLAMALQVAFAQRGRIVTIYFHNGSVVKGELSKLPNEEKFRLQTANGSVFLFTSQEVKDVRYEDGTRPGAGNRQQYQQQPPQQQYPQQQQTYPPSYQQNQGNQPQQLNRQQQQSGVQSQNSRVIRVDPEEELIEEDVYDDEYYDDYDYALDEDMEETPVRTPRQAVRDNAEPNAGFVPGYHGIIDFGYTFGMGDSIHAFSRMEFTITQGYQFSPSLFVGVGTGVHLYSDSVRLNKIVDGMEVPNCYLSYVFPVFVDIRYNFSNGKIKPFAALKAGYSIGLSKTESETQTEAGRSKKTEYKAESLGFYVAPSIGVKFMIGRSMAFSLGAGYSMQMYGSETFKPDNNNVILKKADVMGGVTLKAGLEF